MKPAMIVLLLGLCLSAIAQETQYFCSAKRAASVTMIPGENGPTFESDSGTSDKQWIIENGKARSLQQFGELPCTNHDIGVRCRHEDRQQPYLVLTLDDMVFAFQMSGFLEGDRYRYVTYIGTCVAITDD